MCVLAASLVPLASVAWGNVIPEVGIGAVHPICDSLESECTSSDEQVQDDLIAELEADEQITGEYDFGWSALFAVGAVRRPGPSLDLTGLALAYMCDPAVDYLVAKALHHSSTEDKHTPAGTCKLNMVES